MLTKENIIKLFTYLLVTVCFGTILNVTLLGGGIPFIDADPKAGKLKDDAKRKGNYKGNIFKKFLSKGVTMGNRDAANDIKSARMNSVNAVNAMKKSRPNAGGAGDELTESDNATIQKAKNYVETKINSTNGNKDVGKEHEKHLRKLMDTANEGKGLSYEGNLKWKEYVVEWKAKNQKLIEKAENEMDKLDPDDEKDEEAIIELKKEIAELRAESKMTITRLNLLQKLMSMFGVNVN